MEFEKKVCPDCNGSGVYQEYDDEFDRYHVHACAKCDGAGSMANQPSDEGRFPDEAEREYSANYEAKCKKTGVNLLAEPSDADVAEIVDSLEADCEYGEQQEQHKVAVDVFDLRKAITALRQMQKPTDEAVREAIEYINVVMSDNEIFRDGDFGIPTKTSMRLLQIRKTILTALQQMRTKLCDKSCPIGCDFYDESGTTTKCPICGKSVTSDGY